MSWYGLLTTLLQREQVKLAEQSVPPRACPHDGEPLQPRPDGGLHCPFDGWQWPEGDSEAIR
jgi:hypothetical protein